MAGSHNLANDIELTKEEDRWIDSSETEPYTIVSLENSSVIFVDRQILLVCLPPECLEDYLQFKPEMPDDVELRRRYYEHVNWTKYKSHLH
jgi:hypothetical protein